MFLQLLKAKLDKTEIDQDIRPYLKELSSRTGAGFVTFWVLTKSKKGYVTHPFLYSAEKDLLVLLEEEVFDSNLANVTLNSHQLSIKIIKAIEALPEDRAVVTNPFTAPIAAAVPKPITTPVPGGGSGTPSNTPGNSAAPALANIPGGLGNTGAQTGVGTEIPGDDDTSFYKAWWFWTGVGVIVVSAVAGSVLLLQEEEPEPATGFSATVTW